MSKRAVRFLRGGRRSGISKPPSETPPAAEGISKPPSETPPAAEGISKPPSETPPAAEGTSNKVSDPAADPRDRETIPEGMLRRAYVPRRPPPAIESPESEEVAGSFDKTPESAAAAAPESAAPESAAPEAPESAPARESDSRPTQPEPAVVKALAVAAELAQKAAQPGPDPKDAQPEPESPAVDAAISELAASRPDHRLVEQPTLEPRAEPSSLEPRAEPSSLEPRAEPVALEPEAEPSVLELKSELAALEPTARSAAIRPPPARAVSELGDTEPSSPSRNRLPSDKSLSPTTSPTTNDADPDSEDVGPSQEEISPETLAVRARLRRIVGAGIGLLAAGIAAGVIVVAASKSGATGENASANRTATTAGAPAEHPSLPPLPPLEPATDKGPSATSPASSSGDPSAPPSGEGPNAEKARELNAQVLALLKRRKSAEAVPIARAAIEADPADALPYLYLGSALQDMGRWKDAMTAYDACVRRATRGMVDECRAMGGQKK